MHRSAAANPGPGRGSSLLWTGTQCRLPEMAAVATAVLRKPGRTGNKNKSAAQPWKFSSENQVEAHDQFHYEENLGDLDAAHLMQMLAISGVQPNEQLALASRLIETYDQDQDGELNEREQVAFKSDVRCGAGPVDIMLDANDQVARPSVLMQDIAARARSRLERKRSYQGLLFVLLHCLNVRHHQVIP